MLKRIYLSSFVLLFALPFISIIVKFMFGVDSRLIILDVVFVLLLAVVFVCCRAIFDKLQSKRLFNTWMIKYMITSLVVVYFGVASIPDTHVFVTDKIFGANYDIWESLIYNVLFGIVLVQAIAVAVVSRRGVQSRRYNVGLLAKAMAICTLCNIAVTIVVVIIKLAVGLDSGYVLIDVAYLVLVTHIPIVQFVFLLIGSKGRNIKSALVLSCIFMPIVTILLGLIVAILPASLVLARLLYIGLAAIDTVGLVIALVVGRHNSSMVEPSSIDI